ncbi:GerMN domain-containing protein [Treponema pectinovorum]|uniref:GerMN domain-containing protein n=1 Tax=Treponema pectinovorum TaxID=164 RepID=UPI0011CCD41C|nr:GerMN domain-containing protein [Treponema pectinovorum]
MAKNYEKKNNQTGLALACWILGFLVLLIVFLIKQDDIYSNLKSTRFFERLFGKTPTFIQNHEINKDKLPAEDDSVINLSSKDKMSDDKIDYDKNLQIKDGKSSENIENKNIATSKKQTNIENEKTILDKEKNISATEKKVENFDKTSPSNEVKIENPKPAISKQKLYFVYIGEDGVLSRKMINRQVERNNSPLLTNINLLLKGPSPEEDSKGYRSLIPNGTKILSASVRDGVAYLNFNEDFEFNTLGPDGYYAQLMQIVYTATEFSTVNSVQFLIEGQKKEYLGSEGVWIGSPLSRASFN